MYLNFIDILHELSTKKNFVHTSIFPKQHSSVNDEGAK